MFINLKINQMKKRFLHLLLLSVSLMALLTACEYDWVTPAPEFVAPPPESDTISYSQDIQPIFDKNCVSCHSGGIAPDCRPSKSYTALVPAYVVAKEPQNSELYTKCASGGSMAPYTTAANLSLIERWIKAGAKND